MFLFRDWVAGGWGQNQKMMIFFYFDESNKEFPLPPNSALCENTFSIMSSSLMREVAGPHASREYLQATTSLLPHRIQSHGQDHEFTF